MARLRKSQLGGKNKKDITRKAKRSSRLLNPWGGPNVPKKARSKGRTTAGSSARKPAPSPQLKGVNYPANKPGQWVYEPDFESHKLPPPLSGYTPEVAASHNAAVERAYQRAGYQ